MKRRSFLKTGILAGAGLASAPFLEAAEDAASVSQALATGMIWCSEQVPIEMIETAKHSISGDPQNEGSPGTMDLHAIFLKELFLSDDPLSASIHLFCFTRYRLYVNGEYIGRGPSRFQNQRPEYDTRDVISNLHAGRNVIAVLVHRDASSGRVMYHQPGLTAVIDLVGAKGGRSRVVSDRSWRSKPELSFGPRERAWASIPENIDARRMPDWQASKFDGTDWPHSVRIDPAVSFPIWSRATPLQSELPLAPIAGVENLPRTLHAGEEIIFDLPRIAQVYAFVEFEAETGSHIEVTYGLPENRHSGRCSYVAREGFQKYLGGDTFCAKTLHLKLISGHIELKRLSLHEVRYPFERLGSFTSNDPFLDHLWQICARSLEVLSEDAYVDCADRERVEWMDCSPPAFDCTRVMMAGPGHHGARCFSDPRLLKAMLRRTALTQQPDGVMKAHTCSDRFDIHAIMEDRTCDWVISLRQYFESTGDKAFVRELWSALTRLLQWFSDHLTPRGLVLAREWEMWDNPLRYQVCEGAGLNAFVYRALQDAAYLGKAVGYVKASVIYAQAAFEIRRAFNETLWDASAGTYSGGFFGVGSRTDEAKVKGVIAGIGKDGLYLPTLQAALLAIDCGLVPPERFFTVVSWVLRHQVEATKIMSHYFLYRVLYSRDSPDLDISVLKAMRSGWRQMVESPWQTAWEDFDGGSKVHIYGIAPAYFLSSFVLGVRLNGPASKQELLIEPHPGDLHQASGIVVTEFGAVPVSWILNPNQTIVLDITIPAGITANVRIPVPLNQKRLSVNGKPYHVKREAGRLTLSLSAGKHTLHTS